MCQAQRKAEERGRRRRQRGPAACLPGRKVKSLATVIELCDGVLSEECNNFDLRILWGRPLRLLHFTMKAPSGAQRRACLHVAAYGHRTGKPV